MSVLAERGSKVGRVVPNAPWPLKALGLVSESTDYVANGSFASLKANVKYRSEPDHAVLVRFTDFAKGWKRNFVFVDEASFLFLKKSVLLPGDVVVSNVGDPGRVFRVPDLGRPMTLGPNAVLIRPYAELDRGFLAYFFSSPAGQALFASITTGTAQRKFNKTTLRKLEVPLPPLPDQRRIVAEIEKQFTRLDAGVAALRRTQANLKRYRAAVLKAACEGRLVPTEAELHRQLGTKNSKLETGEALLRGILAERRQNWQGCGKYKDPTAPDTTNLPPIPGGWTWANVEQLLREPLCNGVSVKGSDNPPGVRALRLSAMSNSGFDYSDVRYLPLAELDVDDLWIEEGDFFMSRGNGSLHLVGRGTPAQKPIQPTIFPDTMIRLRLSNKIGPSGWIRMLWPSRIVRSQIETRVKTTAGIYKIAQPQVEGMVIPLPPLAEQTRIVAEVERRLSVVEELETVVTANLQRASRLRQAVLQRAFTGKQKSAS